MSLAISGAFSPSARRRESGATCRAASSMCSMMGRYGGAPCWSTQWPMSTRRARRPEHAADGIRSEDRRSRRDRLDPLGDDQSLAVQAAVVVHDLAGVETDAELQGDLGKAPVQARDAALNLLRAGDGATRGLEG